MKVTELDNGLVVILQELDYAPVTAVTVSYGIGSIWESSGGFGMSHFCEHMMFKGSENYGSGKYWQLVQMNGGIANAYTSRETTVYYSAVPKSGLIDILKLEADRMLRSSMTEGDVRTERSVVLEEELLTQRDNPGGALDRLLYGTAFGDHPFGRPITGTAEDIAAFNRRKLMDFYREYYTPANAVISVVGDIRTAEVLDHIEELFGKHPEHEPSRPGLPKLPEQEEQRRAEMGHTSHLPRVSIGFRVPGADHPLSSALTLVSIYLASGRSSLFEELLVKPSMALDVSASTNTGSHTGLYTIHLILPENGDTAAAEEVVFSELDSIARNGIDSQRLQKLKKRRTARGIITDANPLSRSRRFATGSTKFSDPFFYWKSIAACGKVDAEAVKEAASTLLVRKRSSVAVLRPSRGSDASVPASGVGFREGEPDLKPPAGQLPESVDVPDRLLQPSNASVADGVREVLMDNGLRLILKRDDSFPVVSFGFSCRMGSNFEPSGLTGLSEITSEAMLYGTADQDSIRFNARLEDLGTGLNFSSTNEYAGGIITSLSTDVSTALSVISDLLRRPAFRSGDIEAVKNDAISSLEEWLKSPVGAAMESFSRQSTDPEERSSVPTVESLSGISRDDVADFHRRYCRPCRTVLVVVGRFREEQMETSVKNHFGDWEEPGLPAESAARVQNSDKSSTERIPLKGREQIAVLAGTPAPPRLHSDSYAVSLLNSILGEGIGSRLGRNIRQPGLSYSANSIYIPLAERGRLVALVLTSPASYGEAFSRLREEIRDLRKKRVSESELRLEKAAAIGRQEFSMMKYDSIAQILLSYASLGLPLDHDRFTLREIAGLSRDHLREAAEKWLGGEIKYISIAGGIPEKDEDETD